MATINTARHYRIDQLVGSISIGRRANLIILDDLQNFRIKKVIIRGKINPKIEATEYPSYVFKTVKYKKIEPDYLNLKSGKKSVLVHIIEVIPGQLITNRSIEELKTYGETVMPDLKKDILAIAVIERYGKSGSIGRGFVRGFNLKEGAIGQSVAHDSHNVILVGTNFEDMALCANKIRELQGGIVVAKKGVIDYIHLPFAGIISVESAYKVDKKLHELTDTVKMMGCKLCSPFIQMSFLSLPVIPSLKITDRGTIDVDAFKIIEPIKNRLPDCRK